MAVSWLTIGKDSLSFGGSVLIVAPWIRDFIGRIRHQRIADIPSAMKSVEAIKKSRADWLARAKPSDLWLTMVGLLLLTASFAIALGQDFTGGETATPLPPAASPVAPVSG